MIDTHTHLYFADESPDGGAAAVDRALAAGVSHMILPNVSLDSMEPLLALHHARPEATSVAVGLHPEDIDADWRPKVEDVFARFADESPVAVGEVGIDLYHDTTFRIQQMDAFGEQLERAAGLDLPVIIHCREGLDETLHILGLMGERVPRMVFHSFTAGPAELERITSAFPEAFIGINGVVTFKNAPDLREAVARCEPSRILLETDSPYLAPVPKRGRTNESSLLCHIRDCVAATCGLPPAELERITDTNAKRLFTKCRFPQTS